MTHGQLRSHEAAAAMPTRVAAVPTRVAQQKPMSGGRGVSPDTGARGRGVTPEGRTIARGLSVERGESEVGSKGRAVHRKDSSATGPSSLHSGSAASEPVGVDPLAHRIQDIRIQAGSGSGSSGNTGNGGNGNGASAGRGSTRGRRDRADEWVRRTRPDEVESKVCLNVKK